MSTPASDISGLLDQLRTQWLEVVRERDELQEALRGYVTERCRCYKGVRCQNCETRALLKLPALADQKEQSE